MSTVWLVTTGQYSDYTVQAVALTEAEARQYADAYDAARESLYRDEAEVEEVDLHRDGDPLPRSVTVYNAESGRAWPFTTIMSGPAPQPNVSDWGGRRPFAQNYPTAEAALSALAAFTPTDPDDVA